MGPARPRSAKLTPSEEQMVVEFRRRTMLPLDDMLGHLHECFPQLSRSALVGKKPGWAFPSAGWWESFVSPAVLFWMPRWDVFAVKEAMSRLC